MSKRRRLRRFLAVLILLLILLAGGWTAIWYVAAGRVAAEVMAWEQQQRARGWTITHGTPRRSGWPMAAGVTLPGVRVSGGARYLAGGVAWQAESLRLAVDIRHLRKLYWGVTGRQTVTIGQRPAIPFQATIFAGEIARSPGDRPGLFQLHATGLIAAIKGRGGAPQALSVASLDAALDGVGAADAAGDALVVAATMTDVGLPPHLLPWLGGSLRSLAFDVALSGPMPAAAGLPRW